MNSFKAKAKAHTMQGLVKYHGLKDHRLRIPYHDSISVNLDAFWTVSEVEFHEGESDIVVINGAESHGRESQRVVELLDVVRHLAGNRKKARIDSQNYPKELKAKGLGFSSSAGAAITAAAFKASGLADKFGWDRSFISRLARHFAGSACRTVVGAYARWIAGNSDETSYAVKIADKGTLPMGVVVVPLHIEAKTEEAHKEALSSPFFSARIARAQERADEMERAIKSGDFRKVGELSEADSLELHAVTMTGSRRMILMTPESLKVVDLALSLRKEGLPVYFSMQTGPTVYLDMPPDMVDEVAGKLTKLSFEPIISSIGGPVEIMDHS